MTELTDAYLSGSWNGFFTYQVVKKEDQPEKPERKVNFIMSLNSSDGQISGTSTDDETRNVMTDPATLLGFVDEGFISFIKQYPYAYFRNEADELLFDETTEHPPVHYSGEYIAEEECFRGIWEIEYYVHDVMEESQLFVETGNWEMKKQ